ncbi:hypothetical protein BGZ65_001989, partial [Modicella reniformis]
MFCNNTTSSSFASQQSMLSSKQTLELANIYLENAAAAAATQKIQDGLDLALELCNEAEIVLIRIKRVPEITTLSNNNNNNNNNNPSSKFKQDNDDDENCTLRQGVALAYSHLGQLLTSLGKIDKAQASYNKARQWGGIVQPSNNITTPSNKPAGLLGSVPETMMGDPPLPLPSSQPEEESNGGDIVQIQIPQHIFPENVLPHTIGTICTLPTPDERLNTTPQLAYCLSLLKVVLSPDEILDPISRNWLQATEKDTDEQERLQLLATDMIRAFKRDELKNTKAIDEVICLTSVLRKNDFRFLLTEFYSAIDHSTLLDIPQLEGLAQLIHGADPDYLDTDDLVKILQLLHTRLKDTHRQSPNYIYKLTLTVSNVLDAMADTKVRGLDREKLHEPLSSYLNGLKESSDPYLVYHAAYAFQALQFVPDNETLWQATMRRTGRVIQGVSGLVSAVKSLDLNGLIEGLGKIQQGFEGVTEAFKLAKTAYNNVNSLVKSGQDFLDCLQEGFCFERKRAWYPALRGLDALIQEGQLAKFKKLVCEAPCRLDLAFQWGVCQRLGEIAASMIWDTNTRQGAIEFLGEIYRNDAVWGQQASIKQWILDILMQLSSLSVGSVGQDAETMLQELETDGDVKKRILYQTCREEGPSSFALKIRTPLEATSTLLDRVQNRPDVEASLRQLRKKRLDERGNSVYIPPQAKASLQSPDDARFPLMDRVEEFLESDQKVFLVLGDSGAGKSTYNRELECDLWKTYNKKTGVIPLYISLAIIDKPEQDMISKQLRKAEFSEAQIRELKVTRKFVLICDGYDESQQTINLYNSNRLNQPGEWVAKMVISCRSEYLGMDYRDRFQPVDSHRRSLTAQFQEAVITPFSADQVHDYIKQYVSTHRPLWKTEDYLETLDHIPSLKELVKNPFLMTLSLEVLPRMVDPGQPFSITHVTKVSLYDQFVEQWLERGKRRLGEKGLSDQAKAAFESLSDEGFTLNGIDYLKKLSAAIYKEQGGQPVVEYSRFKDEGSWKETFFNREDERQLLREASPLTRSGNQYRFIHRSLLEYGVALAVFDPQTWKAKKTTHESTKSRRGSTSSVWSFEVQDSMGDTAVGSEKEEGPNFNSPLVWRNFVNEPAVLQFLEERVQQEPIFKRQLLDYIEHSKTDKAWRTAAANAITILVRAGVQFNGADLQGIQIPGADLSYGVFDSTQLQDADLRKVNFRGVWLQQADLSRAQMTGTQFGEFPYLEQDSEVVLCTYSPDGTTLAVGLIESDITVYTTSTWEKLWTLSGHTEAIEAIVYSPKGNQIASGGPDMTVRLWNIETGHCSHILTGHTDTVQSIAYSPQGHLIASANSDETVRLWDAETGKCYHVLTGHINWVLHVIFSPTGHQLASSGTDELLRLWNVETGVCSHTLSGHSGWVKSAVYSPRGDVIASAGEDKTVRVWDLGTGECRHILDGHGYGVSCVVFSSKGDQMASCGGDEVVWLWDVETGTSRHVLTEHTGEVYKIDYSSQGDLIASASDDKTIRLWDTETGACRQTFTGHNYRVKSVMYSPKGGQLVSCSEDSIVRLWNVGTETSRHASSGHSDEVADVRYSPNEDQIASSSEDYTVRLWDVETGASRFTLRGHHSMVCAILYSPRGDQIASGSSDKTLRLWDIETGSCRRVLEGHTEEVTRIAYSPQGDLIASSSWDKTVRLWDVETGDCCHVLTGHTNPVISVVYSPKGNRIASCSGDETVRLWDVGTGDCCHTLSGHTGWVRSVAYSPQGDRLVSTSDDMTVRLWDVETGECCHVLTGHSDNVFVVAYSPKGDEVVSGSTDGMVRLWDVETGTCRHVLVGHNNQVKSIVYSPQGDLIASCSTDKSVQLWDVVTGQCRVKIEDFRQSVNCVAWNSSSDIRYLVIGCQDGSVRKVQVIEEDGEGEGEGEGGGDQ